MASDGESNGTEYRVGPRHPPLDKRFKKGAPSPNPLGRPPKPKTETGFLKSVHPFAAALLAFDNAFLAMPGDGDGPQQTRRVVALHRLYQKAVRDGDLGAMKLYLQLVGAAEAQARELKMEMLKLAEWFIGKHLDRFIRHEQAGKPLPEIYPDPRDIDIDADGNVSIFGPMNRQERLLQALIIEEQSRTIEGIKLMRKAEKSGRSAAARIGRRFKRELGKINAALPIRLRKQPCYVAAEEDEE